MVIEFVLIRFFRKFTSFRFIIATIVKTFIFVPKLRIKSKTTKNNVISSYKEDYFFERKIREDRVLDVLDRFFQN